MFKESLAAAEMRDIVGEVYKIVELNLKTWETQYTKHRKN